MTHKQIISQNKTRKNLKVVDCLYGNQGDLVANEKEYIVNHFLTLLAKKVKASYRFC